MMPTRSARNVLDSVNGFGFLAFDYDGAGALPLRLDAAKFIRDVYTETAFKDDYGCLPEPQISMSSDGTIEVAYGTEDGKQLFLTFECAGVVTYVKVFEDEQTTVEGTIRLDPFHDRCAADFDELVALYDWISQE